MVRSVLGKVKRIVMYPLKQPDNRVLEGSTEGEAEYHETIAGRKKIVL